jgi:hypothetical protein
MTIVGGQTAYGWSVQCVCALSVINADVAAQVRGQARVEVAGDERPVAVCIVGCDWLAPGQTGRATRQPVNDVHVFLKL